ncbi:MAG: SDR family NAD(P)-dependent oxidoreductase [Gammaproteobacteria bacterium]|nr:SDR family NAD(P)-dependent oxidoreductase [Gammaproteobacteria bacterium]
MATTGISNQAIWITGASSGIGRALAEGLAAHGNHLILTSRNKQNLADLANSLGCPTTVIAADIAEASSTALLTEELDKLDAGLDMAILCAGDCEYVDSGSFDTGIIERMFNVNVFGLSRSIEAALPALRKSRKSPHIVGISSASAITGLPRAEAYGASKAAVVSMLESLALDLFQEDIAVTTVLPGFVDTPLTQRNDFPMPLLMSSKQAASIILGGIGAGSHRIEFPKRLTWSLRFFSMLPESLRLKVGQRMVRLE